MNFSLTSWNENILDMESYYSQDSHEFVELQKLKLQLYVFTSILEYQSSKLTIEKLKMKQANHTVSWGGSHLGGVQLDVKISI